MANIDALTAANDPRTELARAEARLVAEKRRIAELKRAVARTATNSQPKVRRGSKALADYLIEKEGTQDWDENKVQRHFRDGGFRSAAWKEGHRTLVWSPEKIDALPDEITAEEAAARAEKKAAKKAARNSTT